jgi:hypothetical protein
MSSFDKIHYYENVIKDPLTLLSLINSTDVDLDEFTSITKWKKWSASNDEYIFGEQKTINPSIDKETNISLIYIYEQIKNAINKSSQIYAKEYNIDLGYLTPLSISKYHVGKHMGSHVDSYGDDRSPILSVVFTSNTLPIEANQVSTPVLFVNGVNINLAGNNSDFANIITDIVSGDFQYRPNLVYNPTAEYRRITLKGNRPLYSLDLNIYFKIITGELIPIRLQSGESCTVKFLFEKII